MYFINCETLEDLKRLYKDLAMENHPDLGGDTRIMQEINSEYEIAFAELKNKRRNKEGKVYTKETTEAPMEYKDIINKIINFKNIKIEIIGSWLWISGNTKKYKEDFKAMKFLWSKDKKAWYKHFDKTYRKKSNNTLTFEEMRAKFGYGVVEKEEEKEQKRICSE